MLCCIPKILKNESNSQLCWYVYRITKSCVVSQRYSKMKAIHNLQMFVPCDKNVVLYPKDTQKWKQFTTRLLFLLFLLVLCCIPKILKNESNSQHPQRINIVTLPTKSSQESGHCTHQYTLIQSKSGMDICRFYCLYFGVGDWRRFLHGYFSDQIFL